MDLALIAFYAFAAIAVASAVAVISVRNPVHAALCLVLTFFSIACTWLIAGAEFLGIALILVYVGAVMVLFLFVVMMLDIDVEPLRAGFARYLPFGLLVAVVMLIEILTLIGIKAQVATPFGAEQEGSNVQWLARRLFTDFLLPFETAAVILTVAVIAAVMLTLRRRVGVKHQDPGAQARVRAADRVRMVKMDPVKPVPATAPVEAGAGNPEAKP
ncbi:MAG TPA: NADH-quinone oxidoreductase subunit J [Lysobacter sp.]|nr:NADH-quinone oxidoreductase subunit J [Lysobacter sp.]